MKKTTNRPKLEDMLIGLDLIGVMAELILIRVMSACSSYIGLRTAFDSPYDPYFDGYRASVELFHYVFLAILISILVVPLVVAPMMKLIWRGLSKNGLMQMVAEATRCLGNKICDVLARMNKTVAFVLTGMILTYMMIVIIGSCRMMLDVRGLNLQEKQLMMWMWAPKLCSYLWQSLAVCAGAVIAFCLLVWLYFEFGAPEESEELAEQND